MGNTPSNEAYKAGRVGAACPWYDGKGCRSVGNTKVTQEKQYNNGNKDFHGVALGEIRSDVRHLLQANQNARSDFRELRDDFRESMDKLDERLEKHDKRIGYLEQHSWKLAGYAGMAGVILPIVMSLLLWYLSKGD